MIDVKKMSGYDLIKTIIDQCYILTTGGNYNFTLWQDVEAEIMDRMSSKIILSELQIQDLYELAIHQTEKLSSDPQYILRKEGNDVFFSDIQYPEDGEFALNNQFGSDSFDRMVRELTMSPESKLARSMAYQLSEEIDKHLRESTLDNRIIYQCDMSPFVIDLTYYEKEETCPSDVREEGEICLLWAICQDPTS